MTETIRASIADALVDSFVSPDLSLPNSLTTYVPYGNAPLPCLGPVVFSSAQPTCILPSLPVGPTMACSPVFFSVSKKYQPVISFEISDFLLITKLGEYTLSDETSKFLNLSPVPIVNTA